MACHLRAVPLIKADVQVGELILGILIEPFKGSLSDICSFSIDAIHWYMIPQTKQPPFELQPPTYNATFCTFLSPPNTLSPDSFPGKSIQIVENPDQASNLLGRFGPTRKDTTNHGPFSFCVSNNKDNTRECHMLLPLTEHSTQPENA